MNLSAALLRAATQALNLVEENHLDDVVETLLSRSAAAHGGNTTTGLPRDRHTGGR